MIGKEPPSEISNVVCSSVVWLTSFSSGMGMDGSLVTDDVVF